MQLQIVVRGFSPHELHFGEQPADQIKKLIKFPESDGMEREFRIMLAKENLKKSFENRAKSQKNPSRVELDEGDLVLLRIPKLSDALKKVTRKFFHLFYGPYKISTKLGNNSYELVKIDGDRCVGIHNHSNLRKYIQRDNI